jgi:hypothetical protein
MSAMSVTVAAATMPGLASGSRTERTIWVVPASSAARWSPWSRWWCPVEVPGGQSGEFEAVHRDRAGGGALEEPDDTDQRRLVGARPADDAHDLSTLNGEADVVQGRDSHLTAGGREGLADVLKGDQRRFLVVTGQDEGSGRPAR